MIYKFKFAFAPTVNEHNIAATESQLVYGRYTISNKMIAPVTHKAADVQS